MTISPNTTIAQYTIVSKLGEGGMGEVYRARDAKLGRDVAIKVLPASLFENADRLNRFEQEAQATGTLNHPNILVIHYIGTHNGAPYIVSELLEGETLRDRLAGGALPQRKATDYALQIAKGLAAAHEKGIVHRDIKPENIFITDDGRVKILDFGLAKLTAIDETRPQTEVPTRKVNTDPGTVVGTLGYMSPEQLKGQHVDHRSDIFSFGAILYEMLSGKRAFRGDSTAETMSAILREDPPDLSETNKKISPAVEQLVRHCLEKNAAERFYSAHDLALALESLLRNTLSSGQTVTMPALTAEGESHAANPALAATHDVNKKRGRMTLLGVAVIVVLVAIVAAAVYFFLLRAKQPAIDSVAVLPFQNTSGDPNAEYLSDGISEALINSLTELHQLRVIARTTTFRYKAKDVDPLQIGRDLNVRSVLTGSVRQAGDNLSIQVDLVDATTGAELWGQQYERKASDLLLVKQTIAREVSDNLRLRLSRDEQKQLTRRDTTNDESFQFYLKGRYYWNKRTPDSLNKAIEEFQQAIDHDRSFALGYVGLADTYVAQEHYSGLASREILPKARAAVDRALELDDSLSEAHTTSASVYQRQWRWAETEDELKRAISLNPNYPTAHHFYAYYLYVKRRFDEAAREIKRAHELDPLSPVISENLAAVEILRGNLDSAIEQGQKTIQLDPKFADAHYVLAYSYLKRGRGEDATAEFQKAVDLSNHAPTYLGNLGYCYAVTGKRTEALDIAKKLAEKFSHDEASGLFVASVYAGLGDKDNAFDWLDKDFQQHSGQLPTVAWRFQFESLRSDPRYADLLRRMGL